ncbi:MAG TPA: FGGY-family carbohydrate kinase, partial [Terriglobales bacterium]|nr:FGGY-family carbohydrate kinase [Terriglobales bacterium]
GWDAAALGLLRIPPESLPEIRGSSEVYGIATELGGEIPIAGIAGDQQAAMFGEIGLEHGTVKATFGTSGMFDVNSGEYPVFSTRGAYPLVLWSIGGQRTYCLEGTIITVGAAVQWLRDVLGVIAAVEDSAGLAAQVADSGGVWFIPALQGLGTPHMATESRAVFGGLSRATGKAQLVRAVLEGIAYRGREVFETLLEDAAIGRPQRLRVDGGAASNDFLLQQLANAIGIAVERPACVQASALGAGYLAGLATGVWKDTATLARTWRSGGIFEPQWSDDQREASFARWRAMLEAVRPL